MRRLAGAILVKRKQARRGSEKSAPWALWLSRWLPVLLLVTLPALFVAPAAKESFRLPKLLLSETLGLVSLLLLAVRLRSVGRIELRRVLRHPAMVAVLPLLLVATAGLLTSAYPLHVRQALASLWIAAACLVGWTFALRPGEHRRILAALALPAVVLCLIALGQFHELFEPFDFREALKERISVTSLAGGAFDLAGYLLLPALYAQIRLRQDRGARRWAWAGALALFAYTILLTQTLSVIVALVAASLVLWLILLPWRRTAAAAALVAVVGVGLAFAIEPLRVRMERKFQSFATGDVSRALTGRLDGWRTALWMFDERPWTGVGHGAYRAEFGAARMALAEGGWRFYEHQHQTYFVNAHNEILEAAAEWGIPGCLALAWAIWRLLLRLGRQRRCRGPGGRRPGGRAAVALMWAGTAALAIMALTNFPLRIALVAYPYLLLLSWIFSTARVGGAPEGSREAAAAGRAVTGRRLLWVLIPLLAVALGLQLRQAERRWRASHQLALIEHTTRRLAEQGVLSRRPLPPRVQRLLEQGTRILRDAGPLDPVEVGIPIARGSLYRLLSRPKAAVRAYEEALELEVRSEIYLNLGRIHLGGGEPEAARAAFGKAVLLNHKLIKELRPYLGDGGGGGVTGGPGDGEQGDLPDE